MVKILMVCLGNICRSPLAEGILKSKFNSEEIFIDSAGTSNFHEGDLPDRRSISIAQKYGIDISNQRSRPFKVKDFDNFDMIYVMDRSNYQDIIKLARDESDIKKVKLILAEKASYTILDVPDPYYDNENGFDNVYKMLDEVCEIISNKLKNANN